MSTGTKRKKRQPKAVITMVQDGDQISIKLTFVPPAKTKGPTHPVHSAALEMLTDFARKQKEGSST